MYKKPWTLYRNQLWKLQLISLQVWHYDMCALQIFIIIIIIINKIYSNNAFRLLVCIPTWSFLLEIYSWEIYLQNIW